MNKHLAKRYSALGGGCTGHAPGQRWDTRWEQGTAGERTTQRIEAEAHQTPGRSCSYRISRSGVFCDAGTGEEQRRGLPDKPILGIFRHRLCDHLSEKLANALGHALKFKLLTSRG